MQLRAIHLAGLANRTDDRAFLDGLAFLNRNLTEMGIGRDPTILMLDQDKIAKGFQPRADKRHLTTQRCPNRRTRRGGNIDPVIMNPLGGNTEPFND